MTTTTMPAMTTMPTRSTTTTTTPWHDHDDHSGHDHHGHAHDHAAELREASRRSLIIAFVLISGFMVAEVIGGIMSGQPCPCWPMPATC